jgi:hypothetical protein
VAIGLLGAATLFSFYQFVASWLRHGSPTVAWLIVVLGAPLVVRGVWRFARRLANNHYGLLNEWSRAKRAYQALRDLEDEVCRDWD